jgi:hypothetical protein
MGPIIKNNTITFYDKTAGKVNFLFYSFFKLSCGKHTCRHSGLSGIFFPEGFPTRGACPDLFGACGNDK